MITYLIKSTICLFALYVFFHIFLLNHKILLFNRFYLISSLVFSLLIPFINIPVNSNFTLSSSIENITLLPGTSLQSEQNIGNTTPQFLFQNILAILFILISLALLIRFAINIFRIISKANKSKRIEYAKITLVLVNEKSLPYSFFRYVFVNKSDFENDKIEKELLLHEEAHCLQLHSVDIIFFELVNVVFWFNPAMWLFRKAILLNHEYYADNKVLTDNDSYNYHNLLVNLAIQNNTNYLASCFKYSLIKNRLIMMTKSNNTNNAILRKISAVLLFLTLTVSLVTSQESKAENKTVNSPDEWWLPIIQKHNIDLNQYSFKSTLYLGLGKSTGNDVFTIGKNPVNISKPEDKTTIIRIQEPMLILKNNNSYELIKAEFALQDSDNDQITYENGTLEIFYFEDEWMESPEFAAYVKPGKTTSFEWLIVNSRTRSIKTKAIPRL